MQKVIGATLIAVTALATTAAVAMEGVNEEKQEALNALWGRSAAVVASPQTSVGDVGESSFADARPGYRDRFDRQDLTGDQERWLRGTQPEPSDR